MYLYDLALQSAQRISKVIAGNFSGGKQQEILAVRGSDELELMRPDVLTGRMHSVVRLSAFSVVRSIQSVRLTGGSKDYIVLGSDSGNLTILEYMEEKRSFKKVVNETFGKTGVRRAIPGEYLAVDPQGRAVMIAAIEKQKFVYILNRDNQARITISSPLEAHKSHIIVTDICGLDVGFENPLFACLEVNYYEGDVYNGESCPKLLTLYEVDLGLNHVARRATFDVDFSSNYLIPIPGGAEGPGGVMVCSEGWITWIHPLEAHDSIRVAIPKRNGVENTLLIASAIHKSKSQFFVLIQSEFGDLFKMSFDYNIDTQVLHSISIKYFDTIKLCSSLCLLKSGFIFAATEKGSNYLLQIIGLADNDEALVTATASSSEKDRGSVSFIPRSLTNLAIVDKIHDASPIVDGKVVNFTNSGTPQFLTAYADGPCSELTLTQFGLEVTGVASTELPATPTAIWTFKSNIDDLFHRYIVVSFVNATIVLAIENDAINEIADSGFSNTIRTILAHQFTDSSLLQISSESVRHIRSDRRVSEWRPTRSNQRIQVAAANGRQLVISLEDADFIPSNNSERSIELVCFILDTSGTLMELAERKYISEKVQAIALEPISEGRLRSRLVAVSLEDNTLRIFMLNEDVLEDASLQMLPALSCSLLFLFGQLDMEDAASGHGLILHCGLLNGLYLRYSVLAHSGLLETPPRMRFVGAGSMSICPLSDIHNNKISVILTAGTQAILSGSSSTGRPIISPMILPWVGSESGKTGNEKIPSATISGLAAYISETSPGILGFVSLVNNVLHIASLEKLLHDDGTHFMHSSLGLAASPRKILLDDIFGFCGVIEMEYKPWLINNAASVKTRCELSHSKHPDKLVDVEDMDVGFENEIDVDHLKTNGQIYSDGTVNFPAGLETKDDNEALAFAAILGISRRAGEGCWRSMFELVHPLNFRIIQQLSFESDEALLAGSFCSFHNNSNRYLVLITAKNLRLMDYYCTDAFVYVYNITVEGSLSLVHRTSTRMTGSEGVPLSVTSYHGRLLIGFSASNDGSGAMVRLYDNGKRKLLLKCQIKQSHWLGIIRIHVPDINAYRFAISDLQESVTFVTYRPAENVFLLVADDTSARWCSASLSLDYDTVAVGDKFGQFSILRLNTSLSHEIDYDESGAKLLTTNPDIAFGGAPYKIDSIAQFYVNDTIIAFQKVSLQASGKNYSIQGEEATSPYCLVYFTISGKIGVFVPFSSRAELHFFQRLELLLREYIESASDTICLTGNDHRRFRSTFIPVKNVVDGSLLESFSSIPSLTQKNIADKLEKPVQDIIRKLYDFRAIHIC